MKGDLEVALIGSAGARQGFRAEVQEVEIFEEARGVLLSVKDISVTGCLVCAKEHTFKLGEVFLADLHVHKQPYIVKIKARVVRVLPGGGFGCCFEDMDRRQEAKLDKFILEVQKQQIAMNKDSADEERDT